jgi:hypothetical protein
VGQIAEINAYDLDGFEPRPREIMTTFAGSLGALQHIVRSKTARHGAPAEDC